MRIASIATFLAGLSLSLLINTATHAHGTKTATDAPANVHVHMLKHSHGPGRQGVYCKSGNEPPDLSYCKENGGTK